MIATLIDLRIAAYCPVFFLLIFGVFGCGQKNSKDVRNNSAATPSEKGSNVTSHSPTSPSKKIIQNELNRLNKCDKVVADRHEHPEDYKDSYFSLGEDIGFINHCKKRLKDLGVEVIWNRKRQQYEVKTGERKGAGNQVGNKEGNN